MDKSVSPKSSQGVSNDNSNDIVEWVQKENSTTHSPTVSAQGTNDQQILAPTAIVKNSSTSLKKLLR